MLLTSQRASAMRHIEESARSATLEIDAEIRRAQSVLRALAYSQALASGDMRRFHDEASSANAGQGSWIILYQRDGQQLLNTRLPFGASLPVRPDPEVVARQIDSGVGVVSGVKWGPALKRPFVAVEQPIVTAAGAARVLAQAYSPSYFLRTFAGSAIPETWRATVVDGAGVIVAARGMDAGAERQQVQADLLAAVKRAPRDTLRHTGGDGMELYSHFVHSGLSGWAVIVSAPASEINAAVLRGMAVAIAGFVIAIALAVALGVHTGRRLVRFVSSASTAARALGGQQPVTGLHHSNIGEMEALNDAIRDADTRLRAEMQSRANVEDERNDLLVRERAAREHAERQNAAKDEFLAMLGHELRNPLGAITSAVAVLDRSGQPGVPPQAGDRAREVLRRQTAHLRSLVDDLLEVNRALMGKLALVRQELDLADVVRACLDTLLASGRLSAQRVELNLAQAPVLADATRLAQVLDNILDNALKYSAPDSAIAIRVARNGSMAELTVRDDGVGITPELLPHVFNVFVQGKQSLQRLQGGLGIGLTLVRRLVEMHGGSIRIASEGAGRGTCVTVLLPLAAGAADLPPAGGAAACRPDAPRGEDGAQVQRGLTVLLVEDNDDARGMMTMMLELHGCRVLAAANGASALALAAAGQPDLALIDIGLPEMDGYALARALQSDPATSGICLVALTGYGSEDARERARQAGFSQHVTKPLSLDGLSALLWRLDTVQTG
ncbi:ATP-binding protein [Pseudoduganella sp. LjRoot289]|uniref:hybrid sensor histidine kinase/response regulator n=1 Tax=Pseudoduganella sp. LjRoot289 TaxID=3342314 RepID=UPI003ECF8ECF